MGSCYRPSPFSRSTAGGPVAGRVAGSLACVVAGLLTGLASALLATLVSTLTLPSTVQAEPLDGVGIDGVIRADTLDWFPGDLVVNDRADDDGSLARNIGHFWLTWDADSLYVGLIYQTTSRGLRVFFDLDRGVGPYDASLLDRYAGDWQLPSDRHIDLVMGRWTGANVTAGVLPDVLLVNGDSTTTDLAAEPDGPVRRAQAVTTSFPSKQFPIWLASETAIAWSALYPDEARTVPPYAAISAVALITRAGADSTSGAADTAPSNSGLDGAAPVVLSNLHVSIVDIDGDGEPDPVRGKISGSATFPGALGPVALTASAYRDSWQGRELIAPLMFRTGAAGVADFTIPRLPPGDYTVVASARGHLSDSTRVSLSAGEHVTGLEFALPRLTAVSGTLSFPPGFAGFADTLIIRDTAGNAVDSQTFTIQGGDFTLYVLESGTYTIEVDFPDQAIYLDMSREVSVTAGQDLTDVDITFERKTLISGTVRFLAAPPDTLAGDIQLRDTAGDTLASDDFTATSPTFQFFVAEGGDFVLSATAPTYVATDTQVTVTTGVDLTGLTVSLPRQAEILGTMTFEGPAAGGSVYAASSPGGAAIDTVAFAAFAPSYRLFLMDGTYTLTIDALGYDLWDTTITVVQQTTYDLGAPFLRAVRATRLVLVDEEGQTIPSIATTVSKPEEELWSFAPLRLAARNSLGRPDLYDVDDRLQGYTLRVTKADDIHPPRGNVVITESEDITDILNSLAFSDGEGLAYVSDDAIEVLHVFVENETPGVPDGRFMVGIREPQPTTVVLTASADTLVANGRDRITVTAQLFDSTDRPSPTPDVPVSFSLASGSGEGAFEAATVLTNADGIAQGVLSATGSGQLLVDAGVTIGNQTLDVLTGSIDGPEGPLALTALPGPTAAVEVSAASRLAGLVDPVEVTAQLVDSLGNPTPLPSVPITFSASPSGRGGFPTATVQSDSSGQAVASFVPSGAAGAVTLTATADSYPPGSTDLLLKDVLVVTDPPWNREPPTRNTFPPTDLTAVIVDNDEDYLNLEIPFSSDWGGLQLHVIFEMNFDAAGGTRDAFEQPVTFAQEDLPDYILTTKYSSNDYGDFRRWNTTGSSWQFWDLDQQDFVASTSNNNIQSWVQKLSDEVRIAIPWQPFGGIPDSLRLEVYLTQEENGTKRAAFDSAPSDSTMDLDFDYLNPGPDDWDIATQDITLHAWSRTYTVKQVFPIPPEVTDVTVTPAALEAGQAFTMTARVTDAGDSVGDVLGDLGAMGGSSLTRMYDDGQTSHGDATAGDGIYSLRAAVPLASPGGELELAVNGYDAGNRLATRTGAPVEVTASAEIIVHADDPVGDDHGPNHPGIERKYYIYPTNSAFVPGGFDLTSLDIYRTTAIVGGKPVEMIAFQVGMVDFPDPNDEGTASWNPPYADINIEKIDIMIDSGPGGATVGLPARRADFQRWDAWDFAVVIDGWYKALIPSFGQNTVESWRENARRTDNDIILVSDTVRNTITAMVSAKALGDPTTEDIRGWDIAVLMASHDGGDDSVMGGVRWVDETRSEWRFGGGHQSDHDSNIIDVILIAGTGHQPGRTQEELLDYESAEAVQRLDQGQTPVAIETSAFEDTGPPVVRIDRNAGEVVRRLPLRGAPLALTLQITDDWQVEDVTIRYRSLSTPGDAWDIETPMGFIGNDQFIVDLLPDWMDSNLVYSPIDSARYLEFEVTAHDPLQKETVSPVTTLQIDPVADCRDVAASLATTDLRLRTVDGSALTIADELHTALAARWAEQAGSHEDPDSLAGRLDLLLDGCVLPPEITGAPTVPAGAALGVYRDLYLDGLLATETDTTTAGFPDRLPGEIEVTLHYPQAWVPHGGDENSIGLYEFNERSGRWILIGGHVNPVGNMVTATVNHLGAFGLFLSGEIAYDPGEVVSGILISPNPFSPNGDELYDETTISFYLTQEATVTAEIYNIEGKRKRTITQTFPFSGDDNVQRVPRRVAGLIWNGLDSSGYPLPYGIYIIRLLVTYNQAGGTRTVRSNHPVVLIR
jgi:hypothetical protein